MRIRVFEAFAGYGSQMMALRRVARRHAGGADFQLVGWSEIDDDAIAAHNAVFPEYAECNHGDISKIDWERVSDFDLFSYSFPCQDISNAGLQRGLREGSGSRSSLLWECRRAIETKRPSFLLLENVAALASKKFMPDFQRWIDYLDEQGYRTFWKKINAKDFGVPQNRVRVFAVSLAVCRWTRTTICDLIGRTKRKAVSQNCKPSSPIPWGQPSRPPDLTTSTATRSHIASADLLRASVSV